MAAGSGGAGGSGILGVAGRFLEAVKFAHTLFALPFALLGMLLPLRRIPETRTVLWILAAMVGARTAAMAFNRLADRRFDARNPRTASRALPAGSLSAGVFAAALALSVGLFLLACRQLQPLCLLLAGPTLVVLLGYSLLKRFTALAHFGLGLALGLAPVGASVAVTGALDGSAGAAAVLGGGVLLWVAGFDVVYACQDLEADRALGLHSVPAALGKRRAILLARGLHAGGLLLMALFGGAAGAGAAYYAGLLAAGAFLAREHAGLRAAEDAEIPPRFLDANMAVSILVFAGFAADLWIGAA
ncbi:MAG: putative 4-hydroxybenzoate polyprenyltransferase [Planctomycetes bacterium]|nr:putative 4-hydroxybenzoate polyprenyltransferase [Planctomycetota bacterium]